MIDPYPRQYSDLVTLIRRSANGPTVAADTTTSEEIRPWLLSDAIAEEDLLLLLEALVWRMAAAGLPVDRVTIHVGTLHPQLLGFYWHWDRSDGIVDELAGLQLADLVCHPIGRHLLKPDQQNRAYEVVERKFRRSGGGKLEGYGLKSFP